MAQFIPSHYSGAREPDESPETTEVEAHVSMGGVAVGLMLVGVPTLLVAPWVVKQFKPEWSYSKRVATGMAASFVGGVLSRGLRSTDQ